MFTHGENDQSMFREAVLTLIGYQIENENTYDVFMSHKSEMHTLDLFGDDQLFNNCIVDEKIPFVFEIVYGIDGHAVFSTSR